MDLKEIHGWNGEVGRHWYYASKAAALDRLVQPITFHTIADIGAGSGFFAKHLLQRRSDARDATCIDINYERDSDEWHLGKRVAYRREAQPLGADLYLLMDVLEHVEDDVPFLRSVVESSQRHAHFVITVPAFNFLWSGHDEYLGHYRRYTLHQISGVAREAGLKVEKACYFFGALFPAVAAVRLSRKLLAPAAAPASDMRPVPTVLNKALRAVCRVEEGAFTRNRAFGLTAFVLANRG
ncbi:MAG: methyltransferase domain-containing protein [Rhodospirillaceae bacterium]